MPIGIEQEYAIAEFLESVRNLRSVGVIRSDKLLGDLGEFLASSEYGLELATSGRQEGHDTAGEDDRVQIKFQHSPTRTNVNLGSPQKYDRAIVVLGPDSLLHPGGSSSGQFCFYEFQSRFVEQHCRTDSGYSCGKRMLGQPQRTVEIESRD